MLPAPCNTRTDSEKLHKLSTFIQSTSSSFGQELYISSVKFRTIGWLGDGFCFFKHSYFFFFVHPQASLCEKYDIKPKRKNPIGNYTSALRGDQCHITTCRIYMYTIIKCQVPEAVNKKEQRQKKLRQKSKQKFWNCKVVRDKRQHSQA